MQTNTVTAKHAERELLLGDGWPSWKKWVGFASILIIQFFYCYNFMVGTFVKPTMLADAAGGGFSFTLQQTETIFSVMSFGTIPGTILFSLLAAKKGKKFSLLVVAFLISVTSFLPMIQPDNYTLWLAGRMAAGVTLGGVFGNAYPLVAEMFPQKYRGKLASIQCSLFSLAMMFGGMVYGLLGDGNWDLLMYTAIIPPVIGAVLGIFYIPSDAQKTKEINANSKNKSEKISYLNMYSGKYLWIGLGAIVLSGMNFIAYSSFSNNSTAYLRELGLSAITAGSIYSVMGFGQLIGYNAWGILSDKFGRKFPVLGMALSGICVILYSVTDVNNIMILQIISFTFGFATGYSGMWGAYYTELFPLKYSALSSGTSFNGGRIISMFALPMIAGMGNASNMGPIFTASCIAFGIGVVVWFFLPETLSRKKSVQP